MNRIFLKGLIGDEMNVLLSLAAMNFKGNGAKNSWCF
jgi:hypothetical protein